MIEHELLLLGLLKDGPKHGYEIKRLIEGEMFPFIALKVKSIYYPLKQMEELGLLKKSVGKDAKGPEKFMYRLTKKGEATFQKRITESFLSVERPYFSIDLCLYFLQYIDPKAALHKLKARVRFLQRIRRDLCAMEGTLDPKKKHLHIILQHDIDLVDAEIASITRLQSQVGDGTL